MCEMPVLASVCTFLKCQISAFMPREMWGAECYAYALSIDNSAHSYTYEIILTSKLNTFFIIVR